MEKDLDLSGVDPARWPEIRRRVAILDEYVAIWRPNKILRGEFAQRLGVAESHFMHLASVWRHNRSAAAIPGARSRNVDKVVRRVSPRALQLARDAISALGPMARRKDVITEVNRLCAFEGVATPSNSTITNLLTEARAASNASMGLEPEILIDECLFKIPVLDGDRLTMPRALLAIALPERRIVAFDATFETDQLPSLATLMERLEADASSKGVSLPLRAPHRSPMERIAIGAASRDMAVGKPTINRILGLRIGDLDVVYQAGRASKPAKMLRGRLATPVNAADAALAVDGAIAVHNARMPALPASGIAIARHDYA